MASLPDNWPYTAKAGRRNRAAHQPWDKPRKDLLTRLWLAGEKVDVIADACETSVGAIYNWRSKLGLPGRSERLGRPMKRTQSDKTGQRRFTGVNPDKEAAIALRPHHPAARNGSTRFGAWVTPAIEVKGSLLKSGTNNRKIGGKCEKGRWKGMPIYTLTLEERATCPRSCKEWLSCYGNNMGQAARIHDDGWLKMRLHVDLHQLAMEHPGGFVVRLHVLGDFFSTEYVQFWREELTIFPQLRIFGFTAWQPNTEIGYAVLEMMAERLDRVSMRVSGCDHELHTSEVVESAEQARGIVCPAELDADRCCATCGLCWQSERMISFLRH